MKLEDEIKQTVFRSEAHKLYVNLIYTHHWVVNRADVIFRKNGITGQQYNILRILRGQFPNSGTLTLIRDRMLDKQPDVSRLVERLVKKKYVLRNNVEGDRRKKTLIISEAGMDLLKKMDPEIDDINQIFSCLTEAEQHTMNVLMDKLRG